MGPDISWLSFMAFLWLTGSSTFCNDFQTSSSLLASLVFPSRPESRERLVPGRSTPSHLPRQDLLGPLVHSQISTSSRKPSQNSPAPGQRFSCLAAMGQQSPGRWDLGQSENFPKPVRMELECEPDYFNSRAYTFYFWLHLCMACGSPTRNRTGEPL